MFQDIFKLVKILWVVILITIVQSKSKIETIEDGYFTGSLVAQHAQINRFMQTVNTIVFIRFWDFFGDFNVSKPFIYRRTYFPNHTFMTFRLLTSQINCMIANRFKPLVDIGVVLYLKDLGTLQSVIESNCIIRSGFGGVLLLLEDDISNYKLHDIEEDLHEFWQSYGKKIKRMGFLFNIDMWVYHPFILRLDKSKNQTNYGGLIQINDSKLHFDTFLNNLNGYPVKVERFPSVYAIEKKTVDKVTGEKQVTYVGLDPEIERALQKYTNYTG